MSKFNRFSPRDHAEDWGPQNTNSATGVAERLNPVAIVIHTAALSAILAIIAFKIGLGLAAALVFGWLGGAVLTLASLALMTEWLDPCS